MCCFYCLYFWFVRSISNHSNPLCHGYTCLLAYLLWKRESSGEISTNDTKVLSYDAPLLTNVVEDNFNILHTIGQEEVSASSLLHG